MPLVNPWMIYFAGMCDVILHIAISTAAICGAVAIICLFGRFLALEEDIRKILLKARKFCVNVCVVSLFIAILVPSKRTCIEMMIADKVTYETVEYICDKINEIK